MSYRHSKHLSQLLALSIGLNLSLAYAQPAADMGQYHDFFEQGAGFYQQGQYAKAIEMFEHAKPFASEASIPVIQTNLAACYIARGLYFQKNLQNKEALSDFRNAYYLMNYGWPEGMAHSTAASQRNQTSAKEDLDITYDRLRLSTTDAGLHLRLAKELRLQGKFKEAVVEYEKVTELDKQNLEAYRALGDLYNVLALPDKSKKEYKRLVEVAGDKVTDDVLVLLANAQYKSNEAEAAIASLNRAIQINPDNTNALTQLANIWNTELKFNPRNVAAHGNLGMVYQKMKRLNEAMAQYNLAESLGEQDPSVGFEAKKLIRLNKGTLYADMGDTKTALNAFETILQVDNRNVLAHYYKAQTLKKAGLVHQALAEYNQILAIDPTNADAQRDLLEMVLAQPDPTQLAAGLREYADKNASNALIQARVGEEFHKRNDLPSAINYYQRAIQLKPDLASAYANLGVALEAQGNHEESIAILKKARELDPNNKTVTDLVSEAQKNEGYAAYQKAVELQQAGKLPEALSQYEKAIASDSHNAELLANYGTALQASSQLPKAILQYKMAITIDGANGSYHYYLGTAYHQQQQLAEATAEYKKAIALNSNVQEAKEALALIDQEGAASALNKAVDLYNKKQYSQASTLITQVISKDPANATAYYYKGLIATAEKKPEVAIQSYKDAILKNASFSDAYYALGVALDAKKDSLGAKHAFQKFIDLSQGTEDDFVKYAKDRVKAL